VRKLTNQKTLTNRKTMTYFSGSRNFAKLAEVRKSRDKQLGAGGANRITITTEKTLCKFSMVMVVMMVL